MGWSKAEDCVTDSSYILPFLSFKHLIFACQESAKMLLVSQFLLSHENDDNFFFTSHLFTHCDSLLPSPLKPSGIAMTSESQKGSFPVFQY